MIIIEGIDGGGKSTLLKTLQKQYPELPVSPRVVGKDTHALVDLRVWVEASLAQGFQEKFFDRYRLVSEFIYGPILRGVPEPGFSDFRWVKGALMSFYELNPIIIYCIPPLETVKANLEGDPDNTAVVEHIPAIYSAYLHRAALDSLRGVGIIYDYTTDYDRYQLEQIINRIDRRRMENFL